MATYAPPTDTLVPRPGWRLPIRSLLARLPLRRGALFGLILVVALLSFELFNYGTTEFALRDLLGDLSFGFARWSTVLALAFCGMDFAGIARLMTPERTRRDPMETGYLLGAWFLAATMNAALTWWAVSLALLSHAGLGNELVGRQALLSAVPLFVAALVWLIRVLIIGTFTLSGDRLFSQAESQPGLLLRPKASRTSAQPASRADVPGTPAASARRDPGYTQAPLSAHPAPRR